MKLSFTSLAYPELTLAEVLQRAVNMKFDGVELRVADDGVHLKPEHPIPRDVRETLRSFDIPVPVLSSYLRLSDLTSGRREALALASSVIEMAADVGAIGVRVYGGGESLSAEALADCYRELERMAGKRGVQVLVETHDVLAELPNIRALISNCSEVKFLYDPANVIFAGWTHGEAFNLLADRVAHVHIKDFIVRGGRRVFTPPGEGTVPLNEILSDLKSSGYDGFVSVEWERFWHRELPSGDVILPIYRDYLRRLI